MTHTKAGSSAARNRALAVTALLALEGARREGTELSLRSLFDTVRVHANADPLAAVTSVVTTAAVLFLAAERGKNEKVKTYADALVYCSTSLSVGYHEIIPRTDAGRVIASVLHTIGPGLTARAFDAPNRERDTEAHEKAVLARLDAIAAALTPR